MLPNIIKSSLDQRDYKLINLSNKMRCLLISDKEADKSAAAIDVHVGSALDPRTHYGAAHFLEHMLFQGTEKYPRENEYDEFISNNGGYNNAFTSLEDTNYHFEIGNEGFEGALDRLAQFFISPKFSEDSADREVNAVDSEFNQSLSSDAWHFFNLTQVVSNKKSNYNRFDCGNKKSLQVPGMRDKLLEFHRTYYSSNIMSLCVIGCEDIETLEKWVVEKFSPVINKEVVVPDLVKEKPFNPEDLGKLVKFVPIKDKDILTFFYSLPYCQKEFKTRPLDYLSNIIGHEGENSLLSYLKAEDLALELSSSPDHSMDGMTTFEIEITLTKKGLQNYETVIEATYQYLNELRKKGPSEQFYLDQKDVGEMNFMFADKKDNIDQAVSFTRKMPLMTNTIVDQIIRSDFITDVFAPAKIQQFIIDMCKTDSCNIFLRSSSFEGKTDQVAEWYDTKFSTSKFSESLINKMKNPNCPITSKKLDYPVKNDLIATKFNVLPKNVALSSEPTLVKQWKECTDLWYKKDDKFQRPKSIVNFKFYTNDCLWIQKPEGNVFVKVWAKVLEEYLREFNYSASLAKLDFDISLGDDNVNFKWSGFNDSMPTYINQTISKIIQMKNEDLSQVFDQVKQKFLQDWKNFYLEQTYRQAVPTLEAVLINMRCEKKQLKRHLESFTYEKYQEYSKEWMKSGRSVWYICGNYPKDQAIELVENARKQFNLESVKIEELPDVRAISLESKISFQFEIPLTDKTNENSFNMTLYEVGAIKDNDHLSLVNQIVMQYFDEPFYADLRTKQQLGYVVFSRLRNIKDVIYNSFCVQSPQHSAEYLTNCINVFLIEHKEKIKNITDESFETMKGAVNTILAEKDINLSYESSRNWSEIAQHKYNFNRQQQQLETLAKITKKEFKDHFEKVFFSDFSKRLDLQLTSETQRAKDEQEKYRTINEENEIFKQFKRIKVMDSIVLFKKQSSMYPDIFKSNFAIKDYQRQLAPAAPLVAAKERTYIMVKPDGTQRTMIGMIISKFETRGFKLVAMKMCQPGKQMFEQHYSDLSSKGFFKGLVEYAASGPVCCMVWEGDNVVKTGRKILGATKPSDSNPGTLRGDQCIDVGRNVIHGSDAVDSANKEIALWFKPEELVDWQNHSTNWVYE